MSTLMLFNKTYLDLIFFCKKEETDQKYEETDLKFEESDQKYEETDQFKRF